MKNLMRHHGRKEFGMDGLGMSPAGCGTCLTASCGAFAGLMDDWIFWVEWKMRTFFLIVGAVLLLNLFFASFPAQAEYGDVVMNRQSDIQGVRPVIFSHTFHRIRFRCKACHTEIGFIMRAGKSDVTMFSITEGKYCGACHNGNIAWGPENCNLCHSGIKGLNTGVAGGHQTSGPGIW